MRAVIERAPLLAALSRMMGVIERKHSISILSNVLVSVSAGSIRLRGTDLEMEAIEVVQAAVDEPGDVLVSAEKLHDIVRNADAGAQITISTKRDDPRLRLQSGRSNFNVPTSDPADFPEFKADGLSAAWPFPAKTLANMIGRVAFARGEMNPPTAFGGIYLTVEGGEFHAVACHKAGMALRREPAPEGAAIAAIVLPKFTNQITRWLADADGDVLVSSSESLVRLVCDGATLTSKVFGGQYFDYRRIMIETHDASAVTDQDALAAAARRVMIMGDMSTGSIRMQFGEGAISLASRNDQSGEGADEIACDYDGPSTDFLMNADKLQAALASLAGDRVEISFAPVKDAKVNTTTQVIIRAPSDPAMVINLMQPRA